MTAEYDVAQLTKKLTKKNIRPLEEKKGPNEKKDFNCENGVGYHGLP